MKQKESKVFPPTPSPDDAFLVNPIASPSDRTGYVSTTPISEEEAKSYSELFNVPCEACEKVENEFTKVLQGRKKQ